jgi:hypothetical protein
MATGVELQKIIDFIGHERGTRTKELVAAIRHFGFECSDRLKPLPKPKRQMYVEGKVIIVFRPTVPKIKCGHWVYQEDFVLYDPCEYNGNILIMPTYKPTSYLKIL